MYQIGSFVFDIRNPGVPVPENLEEFRVSGGIPGYFYEFRIVDRVEFGPEPMEVSRDRIRISVREGLETRYLTIPGDRQPYAVSRELDETHTLVEIARKELESFRLDTMFLSLLSPERRLWQAGGFVLHSAYTVYGDRAILFTAPSGTGKSTQAELWRTYRGAGIVNGDRTLLQFRGDTLWAEGWPVCGSSGICRNCAYPVGALVYLSQARENTVERLPVRTAIRKLAGELTVNYHNSGFVEDAMDFLGKLLPEVPVYHQKCDISENAVAVLETQLEKEGVLVAGK